MKNTVYTYPERVVGDIQARDYTAVYYGGLKDVIEERSDMFEFTEVYDDEHIENLAYELYGDENQGDTILASNLEVFLWSMPYNSEVLYEVQNFYKEFLTKELNIVSGDSRDIGLEALLKDISDYVEKQNSEKRVFKVPKSNRLTDIISVIDSYRIQNTVLDLQEPGTQ